MIRFLALLGFTLALGLGVQAQTAVDYYHDSARLYIEGDNTTAEQAALQGLALAPNDARLQALLDRIRQQEQQQSGQGEQQNQDDNENQQSGEQGEANEEGEQQSDDQQQPQDGEQGQQDQPQDDQSAASDRPEEEQAKPEESQSGQSEEEGREEEQPPSDVTDNCGLLF